MRLSIRWRLTLWNTLALAIVLLGFAALVYALSAHALYERIDRTLLTEFRELEQDAPSASEGDAGLHHWIAEAKEHENLSCILYDAKHAVYAHTQELPPDAIPPAPGVKPEGARLGDESVPVVGRQRVLHARLQWRGQELTVVLMAPLEELDHELGRLLTALFLAVPVALAVSGGWGYLLARKALAPMENLRRQTEDITAARLDRRLPVVNAHDELGRLAVTINAMIARLERSFAEIRRFTADASHELRTPLTAIRTETEVALGKPLAPAEYQQLLGSVLEECERLTRLTEQLLALAREDAGAVGPSHNTLDLSALVQDIVETMRPLAEAKGLRLHTQPNGQLLLSGDAARLRQVFYNVLENAIKYTPAGGLVTVVCEEQSRGAVVTVRDTGIGIPAEHLPHVFDRFYRVDKARSRSEGGTGLGLSIAQRIALAHGGQIELASTPGQGSTCTVRLPLGSKPEKRPDAGEAS
jgi:heavy metal sensor kinase